MARATIGGSDRIGGGRRPCRRLLPLFLLLAIFVPAPAAADSSADAWMSARQVHLASAVAIGEASTALADGALPREVRSLRRTVARAVRAMDGLEVHACFQVWWSYVRSSYVMYDRALVGMEAEDPVRTSSAMGATRYLAALAGATPVDCPRRDAMSSAASQPAASPGRPLAVASGLVTAS